MEEAFNTAKSAADDNDANWDGFVQAETDAQTLVSSLEGAAAVGTNQDKVDAQGALDALQDLTDAAVAAVEEQRLRVNELADAKAEQEAWYVLWDERVAIA